MAYLLGYAGLNSLDFLVDRIWTDRADYVDENALSVTVNRLSKKTVSIPTDCGKNDLL